MSSFFKISTLLACLMVICACKKEGIDPQRGGFLKVIETEGPYIARNAVPLPDGSVIVGAVAFENEAAETQYGLSPSLLYKLDKDGVIEWQIQLPEIVHELWHCRLLSNSHVLVIGFDSQVQSAQVGMAVLSGQGEVLFSHSFFNTAGFLFSGNLSSIDGIELQNGNIGVVMPTVTIQSGPTHVRFMEFTPSLELVTDIKFVSDEMIPHTSVLGPSIAQAPTGEILVQGGILPNSNVPQGSFAFVMELDPATYDPAYFNVFTSENSRSPSRLAVTTFGEAIWMSAGPEIVLPSNNTAGFVHNLRNQETFLFGSKIQCWKTNADTAQTPVAEISGFPKNGFIQNVHRCDDGGFILCGTCNINSDQSIPSAYRILLVKLNTDLQVEWMRVPSTSTAALNADAVEIPGGFLVSATHYTTAGVEMPMVFKTNNQGFIE